MVAGRAFDQAMCQHNPHWHEFRGEEATFTGGFAGVQGTTSPLPTTSMVPAPSR
jgi:hypothetical protein